jgi:hypothetical protein
MALPMIGVLVQPWTRWQTAAVLVLVALEVVRFARAAGLRTLMSRA